MFYANYIGFLCVYCHLNHCSDILKNILLAKLIIIMIIRRIPFNNENNVYLTKSFHF